MRSLLRLSHLNCYRIVHQGLHSCGQAGAGEVVSCRNTLGERAEETIEGVTVRGKRKIPVCLCLRLSSLPVSFFSVAPSDHEAVHLGSPTPLSRFWQLMQRCGTKPLPGLILPGQYLCVGPLRLCAWLPSACWEGVL